MKTENSIKKYRKLMGWSQQELADEIGTHVMTISRWESGDTPKTNSSAWHSLNKLMSEKPVSASQLEEPAE